MKRFFVLTFCVYLFVFAVVCYASDSLAVSTVSNAIDLVVALLSSVAGSLLTLLGVWLKKKASK
jgi:uncharacterized membrane protein (DUF485 family)|nr:MAG: hypothetical protein [Microviridae sp.]